MNRDGRRGSGVRTAIIGMSLILIVLAGCGNRTPPGPEHAEPRAVTSEPLGTRAADGFVEGQDVDPVPFRHVTGGTGELFLPEIMGSGAALLDFDNDGDLDLFFVQSGSLGGPPAPHCLVRNDGRNAQGRLTWSTDFPGSSIPSTGYGMGVAAGDYDNDGDIDLYVTALGPNQLLRNQGDGHFEDVTAFAGVVDPAWGSSATFFDYDRDGWLDLFVANYVAFDRATAPRCFAPSSGRDYCGPDAFPAVPDALFHNRGNGQFEDVTSRAGMRDAFGAGLGVVAADLNHDGWCDLYVANDGDPNQLWINQRGTGQFVDEGLLAGVALNLHGQAEAGMGVDAADLDGDGDDELFVTNLTGESNTLYHNLGECLFEDRTGTSGLRVPSLPYTAFGTRFLDMDLDGDLDLLTVNGAVRLQESLLARHDPNPLRQPSQLYRNDGAEGFRDISPNSGPPWQEQGVGRGLCVGDLDNDGDLDLVLTVNGGVPRVLLSTASQRMHWLGLHCLDPRGQPVEQTRLKIVGSNSLWRRVHSDGSYQCASDPRVIVGLGPETDARTVIAHWPDGRVESFPALQPDRYHFLRRGSGIPREPLK